VKGGLTLPEIEFGDPSNRLDPTDTTLAGAAATNHNGNVRDIRGTWYEFDIEDAAGSIDCYHNLHNEEPNYVVPATATPNVRWFLVGLSHSGVGPGTGAPGIDLCYLATDSASMTASSIRLRYTTRAAGYTVNGANPIRVTLFFIRAVK
jgi:hypothetical protein